MIDIFQLQLYGANAYKTCANVHEQKPDCKHAI